MTAKRATILPCLGILSAAMLPAQSLNWEGQTGGLVTPFAYTAASGKGLGRPVISYHYLAAGPVIGGFNQASATVGVARIVEFGYTRSFHWQGSTDGLSPLWGRGFNTVHGKVNVVKEDMGGHKWVPALAVGGVAGMQVRNVGGFLAGSETHNGDAYVVLTKTVTQIKALPMVLNGGWKATNASIFALAGNAPAWQGRWFGAGAIVLKGPAKTLLIAGSEFAQQPRGVEGLAQAIIPTTLTYFVRVAPESERAHVNVDFAIAQVAGNILPGVNLQARHQFGMGISYRP